MAKPAHAQNSRKCKQKKQKPDAVDDGRGGFKRLGVDRLRAFDRDRLRSQHTQHTHFCSDDTLPLVQRPLKSLFFEEACTDGNPDAYSA